MTQRGFTLVEVLVVTVVLTLLGGMALVFAGSGQKVWLLTDSRVTAMTQAQIALNRLTEDLRRGRQSTLQCTINGALSVTQLDGTAITYHCEGCDDTNSGTLVKEVNATPQVVAGDISAVSFTCAPNGIVNLFVTTRARTLRGATQTLTSQVWVKNP